MNVTFVHHQKTSLMPPKKMLPDVTKVLALKLIIYQTWLSLFACSSIIIINLSCPFYSYFGRCMYQILGKKLWRSIFSQPNLRQAPTHCNKKSLCNHQSKNHNLEELCLTPTLQSFAIAGPAGIRAGGEENKWSRKKQTSGSHSNIWGNGKDFLLEKMKFWTNWTEKKKISIVYKGIIHFLFN